MDPAPETGRRFLIRSLVAAAFLLAATWTGFSATNDVPKGGIQIVKIYESIEIIRVGTTLGVFTKDPNQPPLIPGDRLRTGLKGSVTLRFSDHSVITAGPGADIEVRAVDDPNSGLVVTLWKGLLYFFHRGESGKARIITRGAPAGIEGTEVVVEVATVNNTEQTTLSVIDGKVRFGDGPDALLLTSGQAAIAKVGERPVPAPGFIVNNVLQWALFYPAVLDLHDLPLTSEEQQTLNESLAAYRAGDLLAALANYPTGRQPASAAERIYYAALLLSVGQVEETQAALARIPAAENTGNLPRLAEALRLLIATVKREMRPTVFEPQLPTELLAASYFEQSRAIREKSLETALQLARRAATNSPDFGFAWERVAELEFSFGRLGRALEALDKSLALSPRNAQAIALRGFALAAQNRTSAALAQFDQAIAVDPGLGNAWLGRGLTRFRCGQKSAGREDLLIAAALEPQRAILRSYLGKAYADAGEWKRAHHELDLAKSLDSADPTAWLYAALVDEQDNRINEGIRDLEKSEDMNDNRRLYRSKMLLDEDRAVASANLARLYKEVGMEDVALRTAGRAVSENYANYSAHLFLANSYNEIRDPNLLNLRYETATRSEYLIANLLAPPAAGALTPTTSQQEYSKLFERDRFGIISDTEYLSRGAWTESAAQFGVYKDFSYSLDAYYRTDPGQRVNNDTEQRQFALTAKYEITKNDGLLIEVQENKLKSGDLAQYYDPSTAFSTLRINEKQDPIIGVGYHREWSAQNHTLFYATRLDDTLSLTNAGSPAALVFRPGDVFTAAQGLEFSQNYLGRVVIYSGELQQILQQSQHTTILGARIQYGHFTTDNLQNHPSAQAAQFTDPAAEQNLESLFRRLTFYGYHYWEIIDSLQLIGGLSYDRMTFPDNFRFAPLSEEEKTVDKVSPKAGLIWNLSSGSTIRFAYTKSLSGVSLDQSFRVEPSQVAGFLQSDRGIIPESVADANSAAPIETFGLSFEQKFPTQTYLRITGEILKSKVDRTIGSFLSDFFVYDNAIPYGLHESLDFTERSILLTANQLFAEIWSLGAHYRLSQNTLTDNFPDLPSGLNVQNLQLSRDLESVLHQLNVFAILNHPSGFFAEGDANWYVQSNQGYTPDRPGDEFWQFNAFVGFRLPSRRLEAMVGILNITDQDYRLNPLNLYSELPRARTFAMRLRLSF